MEPALNVLDRALRGDPGALSFLEKTASIYILDATNANAPKTYGCWDFLNQALSEVERYEQSQANNSSGHVISLEGHVQLLSIMSQKAARRSPYSDRRLIGICISNAAVAQHHTSAQALIDLNCQTRERVMGRIAAMAFDFSFHRLRQQHYRSAFSNPIAMEGLCAIIAANSISNGPAAVHDFAIDWIIPSVSHMPPFAVASVILHLAIESMGNAAPAGTEDQLRKLSAPILTKVIGPLLIDALRESDTNEPVESHGIDNIASNQRLATIAMRTLERWCASTSLTIADLNRICTGTMINIVEVLSDSLYSHAESIIDAAAELLDTLLQAGKQSSHQSQFKETSSLNEIEIVGKETELFLGELITAVGFQRLRFTERQQQGDTAVCRCLARIATTVALAAQSTLRANQLQGSCSGIVDLLLKAAAHPSVHVCGIALESLPSLILPGHRLSELLLPILQQKVVYPPHLVGSVDSDISMDVDDNDIDFEQFNQFREDCLIEALEKCYLNNRVFYLESCAIAMENLCSVSPPLSASNVYQLEGALFCLRAVSIEASKRALLMNSSPAAQAAAARAFSSRTGNIVENISEDAALHDQILVRCVAALTKAPSCPSSNPLALSQMCQFIGKYANWFAKTPTPGVLDSGAELALMSFKLASSAFHDNSSASNVMKQMQVSPFAEAATALRNILCRSPSHFATPQVLTALAGGWETSYVSANSGDRLSVEDREALCSGICRVLASLPSDQWVVSLKALSRPTIDSLEIVIKKADDLLSHKVPLSGANDPSLQSILTRGADEIQLLSTMTRTFNNVNSNPTHGCAIDTNESGVTDHPSLSVLRGAWPCLSYLAQKYSCYDIINIALGEFLTSSLSFQQDDGGSLSILVELSDMASTVLSKLPDSQDATLLSPMLQFVEKVVETYGEEAEIKDSSLKPVQTTSRQDQTREIVERTLFLSIKAVSSGLGNLWSEGQEQQHRGQNSIEGGPEKTPGINKKKSHESLAALYKVLTVCVQKCPILLVQLGGFGDDEIFFHRAISVAIATLNEKELDTTRTSMMFLKSVVDLRPSRVSEHEQLAAHTQLNDFGHRLIGAKIDEMTGRIRGDLIKTLINGAMGIFPRESLDSAAALLYSLLIRTDLNEAELILKTSFRRDQFLLGDDALIVTLFVLGECTKGVKSPHYLMDFFSDLWDLYQTDDAGGIAGGNVVKKFERKYSDVKT